VLATRMAKPRPTCSKTCSMHEAHALSHLLPLAACHGFCSKNGIAERNAPPLLAPAQPCPLQSTASRSTFACVCFAAHAWVAGVVPEFGLWGWACAQCLSGERKAER